MTFVKRTTVMTVGVGDLYSSSGFWRYSEVDVQGLLSISQLEKVILLYINFFRKKWWSVTRRFFSVNKHGEWGGAKTRGRLWKVSENSIRRPLIFCNFFSNFSSIFRAEESVTDAKPMLEFTCEICSITAPYEHYSHDSPKSCSKKIKFHEKCYNLPDPFRPPRQRLVLVVGAACSGTFEKLWVYSDKLYSEYDVFLKRPL